MTASIVPPLFEGVWDVTEATLPDGRLGYTGIIAIQRLANSFTLDWDISAGRYVGLGLLLDGHLFVSCGEQFAGLGLALYHRRPDGQVSIQWCSAETAGALGTGYFLSSWPGSFEGSHQIVYYLPDGRPYGQWTLTIQKTGQLYELAWLKGQTVHMRGIGLDTPHGLAAGWYPDLNQLAFLDYFVDPADPQRLRAFWALGGFSDLGTETLMKPI
jgi:hypothetical protein